jgi:hypothetical protein
MQPASGPVPGSPPSSQDGADRRAVWVIAPRRAASIRAALKAAGAVACRDRILEATLHPAIWRPMVREDSDAADQARSCVAAAAC